MMSSYLLTLFIDPIHLVHHTANRMLVDRNIMQDFNNLSGLWLSLTIAPKQYVRMCSLLYSSLALSSPSSSSSLSLTVSH